MFLLGSFISWVKQLRINNGCGRGHFFFTAVITLARFMMILPRFSEKMLFYPKVRSVAIDKPPIFIIGHWRSGTTFLHNLMTQDKNLGYMTMTQSIAPEMFMLYGKIIKTVLKRRTPATRPMDNIFMSPDVPQEEEFAMVNTGGGRSFYLQWIFPHLSRCYFEKYALFENISERDLALWKKDYKTLLKKITLASGGRRLVLKNPVNTARINAILDLFPDAGFIHIYRNPYDVFPSTVHLYKKMIARCGVQDVLQEEIEENILVLYEKLMKTYFLQKVQIPPGHLVEVKFEELESDPMARLQHIYAGLGLPGFSDAKPAFREYLSSLGAYCKNHYRISREMEDRVKTRWQFALDAWDYDKQGGPPSLSRSETVPGKALVEKQDLLFP